MTQSENTRPNLTIFLMCHNRPAYAKCAINSILHQTNHSFRLIVSDNSTNDELYRLVSTEFADLEIRRRIPSIPSTDHFNKCLSEVDTELFCLFHDDDLMEPGYVNAMLETIKRHPSAVAYSCNAELVDENNVPKHGYFETNGSDVIIDTPRALAGRYFSRFPNGVAPFPAYIFRSNIAANIPIDTQSGGKYSDVSWLLEISKCGHFIWNSERLIRYRVHSTNDGGLESIRDRLRFLRYLKTNICFVGPAIISDYRFFLYKKLIHTELTGKILTQNSIRITNRYLLLYRIYRFFKRETYAYLFYKLGKVFNKKRRK